MTLADLEIIVIGQFFSRTNVAPSIDKNPGAFFLDLAVGRAGVIDPARRVAASSGVDNHAAVDGKQHRMRRVLMPFTVAAIRFRLGNQLALVLDDTGFFRDVSERKNASPMDG